MESLFAKYTKEREDFETLEDERGFALYKIAGEECYIKDIYVLPEHRKQNIATEYADLISEVARRAGAKHLTGTVAPSAAGATTSLKVLLGYGFKLLSSDLNRIVFIKEL